MTTRMSLIAFLIMKNFHLYLIKLWWQIFQMFVYGDVVMLSELGGIDPEKLLQYRATFICQCGLCCCIVWHSFLFDCTFRATSGKFGQLARIFWANSLPPPRQKFPYAYGAAYARKIYVRK